MAMFLPEGESLQKSSSVLMYKFEKEATRFRLLDTGIKFFSAFSSEKGEKGGSVRGLTREEVEAKGYDATSKFGDEVKKNYPKETVALKVFVYNESNNPSAGGEFKVLLINQVTIKNALNELHLDPSYNDMSKYDISIKMIKEGHKTSYLVRSNKDEKFMFDSQVKDQVKEIDLTELLLTEDESQIEDGSIPSSEAKFTGKDFDPNEDYSKNIGENAF